MKAINLRSALTILTGLLILSCSLYFIIHAAHFFKGTPAELGKYTPIKWVLLTHIFFGAIALLVGPFQFWKAFRTKRWALHRALGKLYVISILFSGPCAVFLSFTTAYLVNWQYAFSLQVWVAVWLISTFYAYKTARDRRFKLHSEWMVRSYIVTLTFVISALLIKIPFLQAIGFAEVSPSLFWLSWSVPLFIYDVVLSVGRKA